MYRGRLWTMRQFAGFGTARQTNERFKFLVGKGQTGLSTAFDLPTLMGIDSDDPRSLGEVGRLGVAVGHDRRHARQLFDGLDIGKLSVSMTINAPAAVMHGVLSGQRPGRRIRPAHDARHDSKRHAQGVSRSERNRTFRPSRRCD